VRRIAIIAALFFAALAFTPKAHAQDQLPVPLQICTNTVTTCAFPNSVTSGHTLIVCAHSSSALTTPTDTLGTTFTLMDSNAPSGDKSYCWVGVPGSSGADTITISANNFSGQISSEWPASVGSTKDVSTNGTYTGTPATVTMSNITTTKNGDLMVCYMGGGNNSQAVIQSSSGRFLGLQNGSDGSAAAYKFTGTNGTYNCVFDNKFGSGAYVEFALKHSSVSFVTTSLPTATTTGAYSYTLQCVGGAGAYTWSVSSGALPSGLSLNSSTGTISGTPTTTTTTPTFKCDDGTNNATQALTLTVNSSAGTISVAHSTSFNGGTASASLGTVTSGNVITVATRYPNGMKLAIPTDTLGTVYRLVGLWPYKQDASAVEQLALFIGTATSGGSDTVQGQGSTANMMNAVEWNNAQAFTDVQTFLNGTNAGTVTINTSPITTTTPAAMVWATINPLSSSTAFTAGTGFTLDAQQTGTTSADSEHALESATGTYTPSFVVSSGNTDGHWVAQSVMLWPTTSGTVSSGGARHGAKVVF
jgi:Putative Ig domain